MRLCKTCEEEPAAIGGECYQCYFDAHEFDEPTDEQRRIQAEEQKQDVERGK